jgi:hypothetical protein
MALNRHWDLVLSNPLDAHHHGDEGGVQWFNCVADIRRNEEQTTDERLIKDLFQAMDVVPLTIHQNTPEWFLLRMLSCTSSSTDRLLFELKKIALDSTTCSEIDPVTKDALTAVLNSVHGEGWNRQAPITAATPPPVQEEQATPEIDVADDSERHTIIAGEDIDLNMQLLFMSSEASTAFEEQLKIQIADNSLTDAVLKVYLEKNGITPIRDKKKNVEKLKKWLDEPYQRRPYVLLSKARLIDACISKFGGRKGAYTSMGNEELIHRLATYGNDPNVNAPLSYWNINSATWRDVLGL